MEGNGIFRDITFQNVTICQHYKNVAIAIYSFSQQLVNNWNSFGLPTDYEVVHAKKAGQL